MFKKGELARLKDCPHWHPNEKEFEKLRCQQGDIVFVVDSEWNDDRGEEFIMFYHQKMGRKFVCRATYVEHLDAKEG